MILRGYEYSFKTKALSAAYFLRQLTQLIGGDNGIANGSKIIRNLEYARIKGETGVPFQALCAANPTFYTTLTGVAAVITQRSLSGPFDIFMGNANPYGNVTTFAGRAGMAGFSNGNGTNALFNYPTGIVVDSSGNVFVADYSNHRIRKITPSGDATTFAGSGTYGFSDGNGTNAEFSYIFGLAIDSTGNLYVADTDNNKVRKITPSGNVTTFAGNGTIVSNDGNGTNAEFYFLQQVAIDSSGNIFVVDSSNNTIRKIQ